MLALVKLALRIATTDFDNELNLYIADCLSELAGLGVVYDSTNPDEQIKTAVIAYCKWHFGDNDTADRWRDIYHEKVKQFQTMTGYTTWSDEDEEA